MVSAGRRTRAVTQDDLLSARTSPDESGPCKADNVEEADGRYRGRPVFACGLCASRRATTSRGTPRRSSDTLGLHERYSPRSPPNLTQGAAGLPPHRSCRARRADRIRAGQGCGGWRESRRGISDGRIGTWKSSTDPAFPFRDRPTYPGSPRCFRLRLRRRISMRAAGTPVASASVTTCNQALPMVVPKAGS